MSYLVAIVMYVGYRAHRAFGSAGWKEPLEDILAAVAPAQLPAEEAPLLRDDGGEV